MLSITLDTWPSDKCAYLLTMLKVLCPRISAISASEAPFMARYEAVQCLRSCHVKSVIPAFFLAVSQGVCKSIGVNGFLMPGNSNGVSSRRTFACSCNNSNTSPAKGTRATAYKFQARKTRFSLNLSFNAASKRFFLILILDVLMAN